MTIGRRHTIAVDVLSLLNQQLIGSGVYMRVQSPIILADTQEPEPDGCLMRGTPLDYRNKDFTAADALLTIEMADTSLEEDRETKQRIDTGAEIPVYWIVNLRHNTVEVYEQPDRQSGEYRIRRNLVPGDSATIALPGGQTVALPISDLVG